MKQDLFQNLSEEYKILKETQLRLELYYRKVSIGQASIEDVMHFTVLLGAPLLFIQTHGGTRLRENATLVQELLTKEIDYQLPTATDPDTITLLSGECLDAIDRLLTSYSKYSFTSKDLQYMLKYYVRIANETSNGVIDKKIEASLKHRENRLAVAGTPKVGLATRAILASGVLNNYPVHSKSAMTVQNLLSSDSSAR